MSVLYTASATAVGGRDGHVKSSDGLIDLDLVVPKEMGGKGGAATNPEQLFAAGYSACFNGALNLMALQRRIRTGEVSVKIEVSLNKDAEGKMDISAKIEATVPGVDQKTAQELVEAAHAFCPYSRATRGNIAVTLSAKAV